MEKEGVKLVGFWVSPFAQRVKWALKMKGVEYEYIEEDVWNKSALLLELNPVYKKVPVLVHNGKVLAESRIILEYIDETWKNAPLLMPQDPYERAMARFWADFSEKKVLEAGFEALCTRGERQEKAVSSTIEALEKLEQVLKGKKFLGGDSVGYLDLVVGWLAYMMPIWEELASMKILDSSKFPALDEWINNFLSHPGIKDDLPTEEKMKGYFYHLSRKVAPLFYGGEI
ncbi:transferase [Lithospermum erythrorhizon]|uniref:Probable glutathione S-transferase n=1 Tax=Lithospermum erythrorhizon TaxID=34254 RepID=A0AAV3QVN7_LITER